MKNWSKILWHFNKLELPPTQITKFALICIDIYRSRGPVDHIMTSRFEPKRVLQLVLKIMSKFNSRYNSTRIYCELFIQKNILGVFEIQKNNVSTIFLENESCDVVFLTLRVKKASIRYVTKHKSYLNYQTWCQFLRSYNHISIFFSSY